MVNIFQLQRLAKRLPVRLRQIQHQLDRIDERTGTPEGRLARRQALQARAVDARVALLSLRATLADRRVGGFAVRCALPKKQQRKLGLLPPVTA